MDMSAAEVKRAASAQPHPSSSTEPNGSEILVRCLQAEGVKYVWGYLRTNSGHPRSAQDGALGAAQGTSSSAISPASIGFLIWGHI